MRPSLLPVILAAASTSALVAAHSPHPADFHSCRPLQKRQVIAAGGGEGGASSGPSSSVQSVGSSLHLFFTSRSHPSLPLDLFRSAGYACDANSCKLPKCQCASTSPPGGLNPTDVPQFIVFTGSLTIPIWFDIISIIISFNVFLFNSRWCCTILHHQCCQSIPCTAKEPQRVSTQGLDSSFNLLSSYVYWSSMNLSTNTCIIIRWLTLCPSTTPITRWSQTGMLREMRLLTTP